VTSATWIAIAVIFAAGLLLLVVSSVLMRSVREEAPTRVRGASWPQLVDESLADADAQLRLDMVERLGIINSAWSRDVLQCAKADEADPHVRSAIEVALRR
jgi:hypothetical protein